MGVNCIAGNRNCFEEEPPQQYFILAPIFGGNHLPERSKINYGIRCTVDSFSSLLVLSSPKLHY